MRKPCSGLSKGPQEELFEEQLKSQYGYSTMALKGFGRKD